MFRTTFWTVPALRRVLPAITSGPVSISIARSAAAASGDESDRATGQETDQTVDINLISESDMVMHEGG